MDADLTRESESNVSKRKRRSFEPEFKVEAVRLVLDEGRSMNGVAKDLGIYPSSLGDWVKQAKVDQRKGLPDALTSEKRDELRRLRKENRELKTEREIPKKAAAFFAKESS